MRGEHRTSPEVRASKALAARRRPNAVSLLPETARPARRAVSHTDRLPAGRGGCEPEDVEIAGRAGSSLRDAQQLPTNARHLLLQQLRANHAQRHNSEHGAFWARMNAATNTPPTVPDVPDTSIPATCVVDPGPLQRPSDRRRALRHSEWDTTGRPLACQGQLGERVRPRREQRLGPQAPRKVPACAGAPAGAGANVLDSGERGALLIAGTAAPRGVARL